MNIDQLKDLISTYDKCTTQRSWVMSGAIIHYSNEYIDVIRLDSSNKWTGDDTMIKMWSIIINLKKDFTLLHNYRELKKIITIELTPVTKGKNKGAYGIRIRNMHRDPEEMIVRAILDYIFS